MTYNDNLKTEIIIASLPYDLHEALKKEAEKNNTFITQTAVRILKEFIADESKHHILYSSVKVPKVTTTITRIDTKSKDRFEKFIQETGNSGSYVLTKIIEDYFKEENKAEDKSKHQHH